MGSDSTRMPPGQILAWQPGHGAAISPEGFPWELEPGTDIVLQLHLNPTGKPEGLRASVGLYFTDRPATQKLHKLALVSMALDIPAGAARHTVEDRFTLPVDAHVLAVLPHAHYLGRAVEGTAKLPDGSTRTLIRIGDWDFNWQTDYKFSTPLQLPKGTELTMRWTFDNSAANPRNPSNPPKPVRYGAQSSDEMAELWLQLLCRPQDLAALESADGLHALWQILAGEELAVRINPANAVARYNLGRALFASANRARATAEFLEALRLDPKHELAHYNLGVIAQMESRPGEAIQEFRAALAVNPDNAEVHGSLGFVHAGLRQIDEAEAEFTIALRLNPADKGAAEMLRRLKEFKASRPPAKN
jgi:hypothetical protein